MTGSTATGSKQSVQQHSIQQNTITKADDHLHIEKCSQMRALISLKVHCALAVHPCVVIAELLTGTASILPEQISRIDFLAHIDDVIDHAVGNDNIAALLERL